MVLDRATRFGPWPRSCSWCGEDIEKGDEVFFLVQATDSGTQVDPSSPEAVFHAEGPCMSEAAAHGWSQ